jgi:hypothetical protein
MSKNPMPKESCCQTGYGAIFSYQWGSQPIVDILNPILAFKKEESLGCSCLVNRGTKRPKPQHLKMKGVNGMAGNAEQLVWVKNNAGNRFLCSLGALRDPNSVSEQEKSNCVDDASRLMNPKSVPGEGKIEFSRSESAA